MSDLYSTYRYIKQAGIVWDLTQGAASKTKDMAGSVARRGRNIASWSLNKANPVASDLDDTYGYRISKALTEMLLPKAYNPDNDGPYAEYTEFLKDTEEGDQYLREAAKLRRRARILLKQIAEAEKEKNRAAKSRYF